VTILDGDAGPLYILADRAVRLLVTRTHIRPELWADLRQEAVTWLLEAPGRAWVRSADGTAEDPEDQLVADIADHLERSRAVI